MSSVAAKLQDTPLSWGTGSNASFHLAATQQDYMSFLKSDMGNQAQMGLAEFMTCILGVHMMDLAEIQLGEGLTSVVESYGQQLVTRETECYASFMNLLNKIITQRKGAGALLLK
jgi:hypothetical protein